MKLVAVVALTLTQLVRGTVLKLTDRNFDEERTKNNLFVKFYAPWCSHCKKLAPTWAALAERSTELQRVRVGKLDCTRHPRLAERYGVTGFPALLLFNETANGSKIYKHSGTRSVSALLAFANGGYEAVAEYDPKNQPKRKTTREKLVDLLPKLGVLVCVLVVGVLIMRCLNPDVSLADHATEAPARSDLVKDGAAAGAGCDDALEPTEESEEMASFGAALAAARARAARARSGRDAGADAADGDGDGDLQGGKPHGD